MRLAAPPMRPPALSRPSSGTRQEGTRLYRNLVFTLTRILSKILKPMPRLASVMPLMLLIVLAAGPREARAQGLHVRGGLNLANAALDPEPASPLSTTLLRGYNGSLLAELGGGPIRLMLGGGYQQHGVKVEGGAGEGDYRLDYATIPVMLSMGPPSVNANASVFLNIGVEPAFLIGTRIPSGSTLLPEDDARDFDVAMHAELGVELPLSYSGPALTLALGYSLGMIDVHGGPDRWRNNTFQGIIGLKFLSL
jgi:hypothetical protein